MTTRTDEHSMEECHNKLADDFDGICPDEHDGMWHAMTEQQEERLGYNHNCQAEESETSSLSASHSLYAGTYWVTSVYDDTTMQTMEILPTPGRLTLEPIAEHEYDFTFDTTNRISGSIQIASPQDQNKYECVIAPTSDDDLSSQQMPSFDDVLGIFNLSFVPGSVGASPAIHEVVLAKVLKECDMVRFVGDRLVLEGPSGAIDCVVQE